MWEDEQERTPEPCATAGEVGVVVSANVHVTTKVTL